MKRFLLWVVGVILGVAVLLGAVMTVSYSFTGEGSRPAADTQFGGQALEVNGSCWQVPLLGGVFDKVFTSPETLTVQKLGVLYDAHPALALPDWASYTTLTIETDIGSIVFAGSASQYEDFLFPANGDYKAKLTVWRLPQDYLATQFEGGTTGAIRKNLGVEHPAKPTGWYSYSFRFTLQASAEVELSAERVEQGGIVGLRISGMTGDAAPTVETDLGNVQCVRAADGWRAYIPAAYNASSGGHEVNITVNGETVSRSIVVLPRDFGTVDAEPEPDASEAANTQFRNAVWGLYEAPAREKLWQGGFVNPVESYTTLVDYGQALVMQSFADMHLHAPQYPMLGMGMDLPLLEWLNTYTFPTEARFADTDYARRIYSRLATDLITNGTTRVCMFSSLHTDATLVLMDELERAGVTGYVGKVNMDRNGLPGILQETTEESVRETLRWLEGCHFDHVKPILTPRFTPSCTIQRFIPVVQAYRRFS